MQLRIVQFQPQKKVSGIVVGLFLPLVSFGQVKCWAYDLTVTLEPEIVDRASLESELAKMNVKDIELDEAIRKRESGYTSKTQVAYWKLGNRIEGPVKTINGVTLELQIYRFSIDQESFWKYLGDEGKMGRLEIGPKSWARSVFSVADEKILIGGGSLQDRFERTLAAPNLNGVDNPLNHYLDSNGNTLELRSNGPGFTAYSFNSQKSELIVKRFSGKNTLAETSVYREIEPVDYVPIEKLIANRTPTTDVYDEATFPVQYEWSGARPSRSALEKNAAARGDRSPFPTFPVVGLLICLTGIIFIVRKRNKR